MKEEWIRITTVFLITAGAVFWSLNYLFLSGKTAQKSKAAVETIEVSYDPASAPSVTAGADVAYVVKIKPSASMSLRGYALKLKFDKAVLKAKSIEYKIGVVSADLGDTDSTVSTVNGSGTINLQGEVQTTTGLVITGNSTVDLARLVFTATTATASAVTLDSVNFYRQDSTGAILNDFIATKPEFKINYGGADLGNTKVNLKLKFQGINSKPADNRNSMAVKIKVRGGDLTSDIEKTATFTSDDSGVWSGQIGFDLSSGDKKYTLYVKGLRHIQKKICASAPSETTEGTYRCSDSNITLNTGTASLDFSKILLLSGDIYGPEKVQDGVVNSIDISYVKNNLGKTDASVLAVCDINLDGKCDTQDYSLIISALSIKNDEF